MKDLPMKLTQLQARTLLSTASGREIAEELGQLIDLSAAQPTPAEMRAAFGDQTVGDVLAARAAVVHSETTIKVLLKLQTIQDQLAEAVAALEDGRRGEGAAQLIKVYGALGAASNLAILAASEAK